ncbi:MAG: dTDP-4-dehydrorhamnose reductase [Steroidobacteraceae bacterium]
MRVLVLGSSGQLSQHLRELLPAAAFWGRAACDLSSVPDLRERVVAFRPDVILNAAAYTAVDRAETERTEAWKLNAAAPAALAEAAEALRVPLVHVSTDYVFGGAGREPYREDAPLAPINVYGQTKLAGELAVRVICSRVWLIRTSWVFSEYGANFVKTMIRLARERERLTVVDDQVGRPTYAGDLARCMAALLGIEGASVPFGTYHFGSGPVLSWCEYARQIIALAHGRGILARMPEIAGVPTSGYPTAAARPLYSVMRPSQALETLVGPVDWRVGLEKVVELVGRGAVAAG